MSDYLKAGHEWKLLAQCLITVISTVCATDNGRNNIVRNRKGSEASTVVFKKNKKTTEQCSASK